MEEFRGNLCNLNICAGSRCNAAFWFVHDTVTVLKNCSRILKSILQFQSILNYRYVLKGVCRNFKMQAWESYTGQPITLVSIIVSQNTTQKNMSSTQPKIKAKSKLRHIKWKLHSLPKNHSLQPFSKSYIKLSLKWETCEGRLQ